LSKHEISVKNDVNVGSIVQRSRPGGSTAQSFSRKAKGLQMTKRKRKLTPAEKARKKKRQLEYMTIFINGKQKRVKRPPTIDGIDLDVFIQSNADAIWLHENELWEDIDSEEPE
jgi:hypothetical protein